jgi:hypothetical protein
MNETPELPDLHESILDEATLDQLFTDIEALTRVVEVIPKTVSQGSRGYVQEGSITLNEGRRMLRDGGCRALQVRYLYEGALWWDTLMTQPNGTRVVRIRHEPQHHDTIGDQIDEPS